MVPLVAFIYISFPTEKRTFSLIQVLICDFSQKFLFYKICLDPIPYPNQNPNFFSDSDSATKTYGFFRIRIYCARMIAMTCALAKFIFVLVDHRHDLYPCYLRIYIYRSFP
jgi:hypothetical protein